MLFSTFMKLIVSQLPYLHNSLLERDRIQVDLLPGYSAYLVQNLLTKSLRFTEVLIHTVTGAMFCTVMLCGTYFGLSSVTFLNLIHVSSGSYHNQKPQMHDDLDLRNCQSFTSENLLPIKRLWFTC